MASSQSDISNGEGVVMRPKRSPPFKFLLPLIYAPALPLIRIAFRRNPVVRDRLFTAVLAGGLFHGFYLIRNFMLSHFWREWILHHDAGEELWMLGMRLKSIS
ncbi:hypothetical protein IFM89_025066 [Coptis chinensis]|uniref:Uncharacterized protein n=1 Tax=Coptis chinensis TaxID=261450 RepID=A0A835HXV4_9MAGN|nr:hypothetical protein IFM89_025066 [Coptis chinensis]